MPPNDVTVVILHPQRGSRRGAVDAVRLGCPGPPRGAPSRWVPGRRRGIGPHRLGSARRQAVRRSAAGAASRRSAGRRAGRPRLRGHPAGDGGRPAGIRGRRRRRDPGALANNRYSADVVAIARAHTTLADLPDLATDNALPRWLADVAGVPVADRRRSWRLGVDIDGPLDLVLLGARWAGSLPGDVGPGSTSGWPPSGGSPRTPGRSCWSPVVSRATPCAGSKAGPHRGHGRSSRSAASAAAPRPGQRHPASSLGLLLERDGPSSLGAHLARLGEAAVLDTRVLLAHRLGADESGWPSSEDRFASDLLLHERIVDPWLRELTAAAATAPIPVLLVGTRSWVPGSASPSAAGPRWRARRARATRLASAGDGSTHRAPPRAADRPCRRRTGRGARRADPRRDPARRADHVRPVHGARAVRPGWRVLPGRGGAARPRRRLPDRARAPPDLRLHAGERVHRGLGAAGAARPVRHPRARRRDRRPRDGRARRARRRPFRAGRRRFAGSRWRSTRGGCSSSGTRSRTPATPRGSPRTTTAARPVRGDATSRPTIEGIVLANEVLDALPVHRVRRRGDALVEVSVGLDGDSFAEVETATSTPDLAVRLAAERIELVDGQTAEVCLALDGWIAGAAATLRRGLLLCIDYGAPAVELYDPIRRRDGTLRAYVRHQVHDDPYRHVGRQDLTAHVDVTAVERAARAADLTTVGITTQAEALIGLGIEDRLRRIQRDPGDDVRGLRLAARIAHAAPGSRGDGPVPGDGVRARLAGIGRLPAARLVRVPHAEPPPGERRSPTGSVGDIGRMPYCSPEARSATLAMAVARPTAGERSANLHARSARFVPRPPPSPGPRCRRAPLATRADPTPVTRPTPSVVPAPKPPIAHPRRRPGASVPAARMDWARATDVRCAPRPPRGSRVRPRRRWRAPAREFD